MATHIDNKALLSELLVFTQANRNDLAVRLVELHALRAEGEITDEEFTVRRLGLHA